MERVEIEVVFICDGYNREGASDMPRQGVQMRYFCDGHNASSGLEPREKNHVCGSVKCACLCERVLCTVYNFNVEGCVESACKSEEQTFQK